MLVAILLISLISSAGMTMLSSVQSADADARNRADIDQAARSAIHWLQRDLRVAGVGFAGLVAPMPLIVPTGTNRIEIHSNPGGPTGFLTQDSSASAFWVYPDSVSGFVVGDPIAIYDATGNYEIGRIAALPPGPVRLKLEEGLAAEYTVANSSAISAIRQVTYWNDSSTGVPTLWRQVNGDSAQPLAVGVLMFQLRYFDNSDPQVVFTPSSAVDQLRIRTVEFDVRLRSAVARLDTGNHPEVALRMRVSPRVIGLVS